MQLNTSGPAIRRITSERPRILDRCRCFNRVEQLNEAGLYPYFRALSSAQGPEVLHQGRRLTMMSSNNYLGLSTHPAVQRAAVLAIHRYGAC